MITPGQFVGLVDRTLGPVLSQRGFMMVPTEDFSVAFRRPPVSVQSRYEPGSHALTIWLSARDDDGEPPLELADALRATDCPAEEINFVSLMQSGEPEAAGRILTRAAGVLEECATGYLDGDLALFERARAIRLQRARAYTAEVTSAPALAEADRAWHAHDYERVREVLAPVREALDVTHRRRLEFAERRLEAAEGS